MRSSDARASKQTRGQTEEEEGPDDDGRTSENHHKSDGDGDQARDGHSPDGDVIDTHHARGSLDATDDLESFVASDDDLELHNMFLKQMLAEESGPGLISSSSGDNIAEQAAHPKAPGRGGKVSQDTRHVGVTTHFARRV